MARLILGSFLISAASATATSLFGLTGAGLVGLAVIGCVVTMWPRS